MKRPSAIHIITAVATLIFLGLGVWTTIVFVNLANEAKEEERVEQQVREALAVTLAIDPCTRPSEFIESAKAIEQLRVGVGELSSAEVNRQIALVETKSAAATAAVELDHLMQQLQRWAQCIDIERTVLIPSPSGGREYAKDTLEEMIARGEVSTVSAQMVVKEWLKAWPSGDDVHLRTILASLAFSGRASDLVSADTAESLLSVMNSLGGSAERTPEEICTEIRSRWLEGQSIAKKIDTLLAACAKSLPCRGSESTAAKQVLAAWKEAMLSAPKAPAETASCFN